MVVIENATMMSTGPNQYLQPDYLAPLPTTLDAKKSPLALLAQTCSQIGADTPNNKPILPLIDKKKSPHTGTADSVSRNSPVNLKTEKPRSSPDNKHLAFKPYETNVLMKKSDDMRPSSKSSIDSNDDKKSGKTTPGRKSSSSTGGTPAPENEKNSPASDRKATSPAGSSGAGSSPIIRSGLEVLGHTKDHGLGAFKHSALAGLTGFNPLTGFCCPPGMEQHANPAFRPPFAGGAFTHHQAAMLAAAGFPGASPSAYLSYTRVKNSSGGETLVPVCKDPYCSGCQFSLHNHQMLMGNSGPCPSGCTQCDHQKYNLAMAMALSGAGVPPSALSYAQVGAKPYVCNWIVGESYCGKRFGNSEELLQHLRSHTADGGTPSPIVSQAAMLNPLNPIFSAAALHRGASFSTSPLSPLSAGRYHPYSKGGSLPPTLGSSPFSAFNPALGPYYSPYAIYGQRLGAAVHQ